MYGSIENLDRERANNVLHWFRGDEGYDGGSFFTALLSAAAKADELNMARLELGFPVEVGAFKLATRTEDGLKRIREVAKS